jgi:hypothetical protein
MQRKIRGNRLTSLYPTFIRGFHRGGLLADKAGDFVPFFVPQA